MALSSCKDIVYQMQMDRYEIFKSQDLEKGNFDMLYANKIFLTPISETMDSWLSDRWSNKDEVIKIESYTYDCFYQFLCFVYSGDCELTNGNITEMVDMAEFFAVISLKNLCDKYLSTKQDFTPETIEEMYEFGQRYSLSLFSQLIDKYIESNGNDILRATNFVTFKKPFVQLLSSVLGEKFKEQFFEAAYEWVERQVKDKASPENSLNFNLQEAIKTELNTIIPYFKFAQMNIRFLLGFVVENGFLLSPAELHEFFTYSQEKLRSNEIAFKWVHELAEKQALKKQIIATENGESFNLFNSINDDLAKILVCVKFYEMDKQFVIDFILEKGYLLSSKDFYAFYKKTSQYHKPQKTFVSVCELAEKQAIKKQSIATKNGENFNVSDSIKADLAKVIPRVMFYLMDLEFLVNFVVEKGFILSPTEISQVFLNANIGEQQKFTFIYQLAVKQALIKRKIFADPDNFNIADSIKTDLAEVMPHVKFYKMDKQFLMDFVAVKGIFLSSKVFLDIFLHLKDGIHLKYGKEQQIFKFVYNLAEKQALQKQNMSSDPDNFNLFDSIKADLAEIIPQIKFYCMEKEFLMDFVVEKGFMLSSTELYHIFNFLPSKDKKQNFKYIHDLARKQALKKQSIATKNGESFNVSDSIKADLAVILLSIKDGDIFNFLSDNPLYALLLPGFCLSAFLLYSHFKK